MSGLMDSRPQMLSVLSCMKGFCPSKVLFTWAEVLNKFNKHRLKKFESLFFFNCDDFSSHSTNTHQLTISPN